MCMRRFQKRFSLVNMNKIIFRRIIEYICIVLLAFVLVGCGEKDSAKDEMGDDTISGDSLSDNNGESVSENAGSTMRKDLEITVNFPYGKRTGFYTGETLSGNDIPEGEGSFKTVGNDNIPWEYSGQWANGLPEGSGVCKWEDGAEYRGQYKNGQWNGSGEYYLNGELWFKGTFEDDKCIDIDREMANSYNPNNLQAVHWGVRGFYIPDSWKYKVKDDNKVLIKTDDGTNIIVAKHSNSKSSNKGERLSLKKAFESTYSKFGTPEILEEKSDRLYELAYKYLSDDNIFPVEVSAYAFDKGRDCFVVTTFATNSTKDYYDDSKCIVDSFSSWKRLSKNLSGNGDLNQRDEIIPVNLEGTRNGKDIFVHTEPISED